MNVLNIWKGKKGIKLLFKKNIYFHHYICRGGVGHVIFALPWFITWYSHVLDDLPVILRLYDLFIVSNFLMPIYVAAEVRNNDERYLKK